MRVCWCVVCALGGSGFVLLVFVYVCVCLCDGVFVYCGVC